MLDSSSPSALSRERRRREGYFASACPHDCPSTCALEVERLDARTIGAVRGAEDNSYTAGVICAKVARYAERIHHPDRLATPLKRKGAKGAGEFVEISWDNALDEVAEAFRRAEQRYDSTAVWPLYYAGTMGLVQRDGINRLRHAMRYSGIKLTICTSIVDAGWNAGVGAKTGVDSREMADSDLIVSWGGNPVSTQINVMTHVARARKTRGAKFVVVDPYRTGTARQADIHLMPRPGTDGALACAVMHVLFKEGYADRAYMAKFADAPADLEAHLATRTPEWAAAITGLTVDEIVGFARLYGRTKRAYIRLGYGFGRSRNGAANVHAVTCLPTVTGAWQHKGGGALYSFSATYHWDKSLIEGLDLRDPTIRMLDMSRVGSVLLGDRDEIQGGPPVAAMLIQNMNPAVVCPDSNRVRRGMLRDDLFVCVHEQFMTDTARLADIVLPATMFLEHDDLYQAGGHTHIQLGPKIVEPFAEARSNHEVICALARRLGARHRGFEMTAREIADWTLTASGWPNFEDVGARRWVDVAGDFETMHFLKGFPHADGRFRFMPDWPSMGPFGHRLPRLPDHVPIIDNVDGEHPFRLVAAPARHFLNSTFTETPTSRKREVRPSALIHPNDAERLGIADGALVELGNRRGAIRVHARIFDGLQPGVLVVESIWPNRDFADGMGVNALTGDDPAPPAGGAVFHDTAVWVRPAAISPIVRRQVPEHAD
ncbi:MAG TPA: molybdopterin oxidoreductase family protein [Alphaproteobacteria bacterium]|nr:molybdopterin oxidoreductase family protein [Alphaproteobacteria bacterium]